METIPAFYEDCGDLSLHHPIDAGKYRQLVYSANLSSIGAIGVAWSKSRDFAINGIVPALDEFVISGVRIMQASNQFGLRSIRLDQASTAAFSMVGKCNRAFHCSLTIVCPQAD